MIRVFAMSVLVVCAKFGCDMCSPLPACENLAFQFLKRWTTHGSSEISALPERSNSFVFTFLAELTLESCTDGALHRGIPLGSILDQRPLGYPKKTFLPLNVFCKRHPFENKL